MPRPCPPAVTLVLIGWHTEDSIYHRRLTMVFVMSHQIVCAGNVIAPVFCVSKVCIDLFPSLSV